MKDDGRLDDDILLMVVELGLGDPNGGGEIVVGKGRIQDFVADDIQQVLAELYRLDVLGTRAFRTPAFRVGHLLAFMQFVETDALEARRVEKQVFVVPRLDEPESPVRQLLDRAFRHLCVSRSDCLD